MPQFRVTIKKVTEASIVIEADTAAEARKTVGADPGDYFALSESFDRDVFTIVKVTKAAE